MAELRLTFSQINPKNNNILVNVSYFDKDEFVKESMGRPFHFSMDASKYEDLRWYLEDYLEFPDHESLVRAQHIERWLNELGRDIFSAIFLHSDNQQIFDLFRKSESPHVITLVSKNKDIFHLPWEMITNKTGPLALQNIYLRRQIEKSKPVEIQTGHLPIRLLLVVSRPDDVTERSYHRSTQVISDAILSMGNDVIVDYCTSPDLDRISEQLAQAKDINQPYHIVYFDGYSNFDTKSNSIAVWLESKDQKNPLNTKSDIIPVEKLGNTLHKNSVPLVILQTSHVNGSGDTLLPSAVASGLLESGVAHVISMGYALSPEPGKIFFSSFFKELLANKPISHAVNSGRCSLLSLTNCRNSLHPGDTTISLNGWFIPQLYQNGKDMPLIQVKKTEPEQTTQEIRKPLAETAESGAFPSSSTYDFIGRENEMYMIMRFFDHHNTVLIHAPEGMGKTSFIGNAAAWLTQSGYFSDGACYLNFERPVTLRQIALVIGSYIEGQSFKVLSEKKQIEKARNYFVKKKIMIVCDNFDHVFSAKSEENKELNEENVQKRMVEMISDWSGLPQCKGRLVLISRGVDQLPLKNVHTFELKGLKRSNSFAHLLQVMSKQNISITNQHIKKSEFNDLLAVLQDNPLLIELVIQNLKIMNPGNIVDDINRINDKLNEITKIDTDKLITTVFLFYTHHLNSDVREAIKWLELFHGGVFEDIFLKISTIGENKWIDIRKELHAVSLIKIDHTFSLAGRPYLQIHQALYSIARIIANPVKEVFPESISKGKTIPLSEQPEIQKRYMGIYYSLNVMLKKALKGVTERIAMDTLGLEELNIKKAITWTIQNQGFKVAVWMSDTLTEYLVKANRNRERNRWVSYLKTLEQQQPVQEKIAESKEKEIKEEKKESNTTKIQHEDPIASKKSKTKEGKKSSNEQPVSSVETESKEKVQKVTTPDKPYTGQERRINAPDTPYRGIERRITTLEENQKKSTLTVRDSEEQIEFAWTLFAEGNINESIGLLEKLDNQLKEDVSFNPDFQLAKAHLTLGRIYYNTNQVTKSIDILTENCKEWKTIVQQAKDAKKDTKACLVNLTANLCSLTNALIAAEQYEKALQNAFDAHEIDKELGNEKNIATGCIQIAQILNYLNRPQEAEKTYNQALQIVDSYGDKQLKGNILQYQGILAESTGKIGSAKKILQQAIEIFQEINNEESLLQTYNLLAEFEERTEKIDKARKWYNKSLKIAKSINDRRGVASIKQKIGMLFQAEGQSELKKGNHDAALKLFEKAKQSIEKSLTIKKELLDEPGQADALALIAQLNLITGNLDQAESYANQARLIDERIASEAVSFDYYILSEIEKERGNNEKAMEWDKRLHALENGGN